MADQDRRVSGNVTVSHDSDERVAFDLMKLIDYNAPTSPKRDEQCYLTLYRHAWLVVKGRTVEDALK